ncbi:UDP-glycosyltransferase 71E1 [Vitis vinifera]|uniref:UDP-glycosyltransferase 71E1 n=1 Tax=Vitis vinifera TaxID=29760 RepID=A0A438BQK7_VITVI|nr:UDP-glycosyltransferase 71E1 [Vitis vinifera]
MKQTELVFIPSPGIGHLAATVEIAKLMTHRDRRLSITILIMKFPFGSNDSMTSDSDSIRFLTLPPVEVSPGTTGITEFLKPQIPLVRDAVHEITRSNSVRLGGAAFLGFMFHLQFLHDYEGLDFNEFKDSHAELEVPSYANPVQEIQTSQGYYVLNTQGGSVRRQQDDSAVMTWLDDQPPSSVLLLCFGSMGSFGGDQVKEIAHGLERSGHRFLWSLRQPPPKGKIEISKQLCKCGRKFYQKGSYTGQPGLERKHILWCSVATWPMFAEQQINAFQMVKDLGLAVEIKMDYNKDSSYIVSAQEIEIGLKNLMNIDNEVRKKREEMKKISRKVMIEGGSSHFSLVILLKT